MGKVGFGPKNPNWKGGRTTDTRGYVLIKVGVDHHLADVRGYAYEHRLLAEERLGRRLRPDEEVHHKDTKGNNADGKIEVLTIQEHRAIHRKRTDLRPVGSPNPMIECGCGCGETFLKYDATNRPRAYLVGHNINRNRDPATGRIVETGR
jgi:hypothetical protein